MAISSLRLSAANWKVAERRHPWVPNYRTERAWMEAPGPTGWGCPSWRNVSPAVSEEARVGSASAPYTDRKEREWV